MLRIRFLLSFLIAALFFIAPAQAQEKIELRLRGEVGDRYLITIATDDKWTEVYEAEKSQWRTQLRVVGETEVLAPRKDGALRFKITYRQMAVTDFRDGIVTRYDSQRDAKSSNLIAVLFNAMIGQSLTAAMNSKGRILHIEDAEEFKDRLISVLKLPAAENERIRESLKDNFSPQMMAQAAGVVLFPSKAVTVGDRWQRKHIRREELYSAQVTQLSTLKSIGDDKVTIEISEKITADPKTKILRQADGEYKYMMIGQGKGTMQLEKTTGQVLYGSSEERLVGKLIFNYQTREEVDTVHYPVYSSGTMRFWARKLE